MIWIKYIPPTTIDCFPYATTWNTLLSRFRNGFLVCRRWQSNVLPRNGRCRRTHNDGRWKCDLRWWVGRLHSLQPPPHEITCKYCRDMHSEERLCQYRLLCRTFPNCTDSCITGTHGVAILRNPVYINYIHITPPIMRKIEEQMNNAIRNRKCWAGSNTTVTVHKDEVDVMLHGHCIAWLDTINDVWTLSSCGWETVTTKSRLNAILEEFAPDRRIFQTNWQWFLSDTFGMAEPFIDGMQIKWKELKI